MVSKSGFCAPGCSTSRSWLPVVLGKEPQAIEAYREKHQGPLLTRANDYFTTLTLGSFRGLETDFSEDHRQVLVGVRKNHKRVAVDAMSEGTRDQLYLALRLAAIERHLEAGPPLPVIVNDILVQFDDERARAAFGALGMLAAHTQVLVLTHHGHLVPLAEESTAKGVLAVHRLEILPRGVSRKRRLMSGGDQSPRRGAAAFQKGIHPKSDCVRTNYDTSVLARVAV